MTHKSTDCPHCGGINFQTCQDEYVIDILGQANALIICWKCNHLMIAKPIPAKSLREPNRILHN